MNIPIVLQGPTTYCREISEFYKDQFCVWSTWNSEPEENLEYISKLKNSVLITDTLPTYSQNENIGLTQHESWTRQRARYQFTSTLNGFNYLKEHDFNYGIKIRSDMLIDIPVLSSLTNKDCFNSFGWHRGSVGYFIDYYFSGSTELIISLMKMCLENIYPTHSENLMTYMLLEKLNFRSFNYTLIKNLYIYSLKHGYTTDLFFKEISKNKWINKTDIKQTSENVNYSYCKDNYPDNYKLTRGWGPS